MMTGNSKKVKIRARNNLKEYFHRPSFHKIFIHDLNYFAVRIPTDFVHQLEEEMPDTAILTVSSGCSWHIKVVKGEDGISLEDGWQKFRDDNNLSPGEVLLFRYSQDWKFDVQIFSPQGLERNMGDPKETGKEVESSKVRRKRGKPRKESNSVEKASSTLRACWKDPDMAKLFLDLCLQAVARGCSKLKSMPWEDIRLALKQEKGNDLTTMQLMHRWNNEKSRYKVWCKLVTAAGNTHYDPIENKVNWSEKQWKEYLKINPEAVQFAHRSLEYPTEMAMLFDA